MEKQMTDGSYIIGAKITQILRKPTGVDLETDLQTFRYMIGLSNGLMLEFFPGDILISDEIKSGTEAEPDSGIPEASNIIGKEIIAIGTFEFGQHQLPNSSAQHPASRLHDLPRHVALILSSGRVAINFYLCGGSSEIQIVSVEALTNHFAKPWLDYWTGRPLDLAALRASINEAAL